MSAEKQRVLSEIREYCAAHKPELVLKKLLEDAQRLQTMKVELDRPEASVLFDFSKENIDAHVLGLLGKLWEATNTWENIQRLGKGERVNFTEKRPVLHNALRKSQGSLVVDGVDVIPEILAVRNQIQKFSAEVRSGERKGASGKQFTTVVNIGIGGSLLGLKSSYEGLQVCSDVVQKGDKILHMRFIANVDPADFSVQVRGLDVESTLVIISSKSFTTMETGLNLALIKQWLIDTYKASGANVTEEEILKKHILASTANPAVAEKAGFPQDQIFKFWDWVGGRYSVKEL